MVSPVREIRNEIFTHPIAKSLPISASKQRHLLIVNSNDRGLPAVTDPTNSLTPLALGRRGS
jgi:hypothetical protein